MSKRKSHIPGFKTPGIKTNLMLLMAAFALALAAWPSAPVRAEAPEETTVPMDIQRQGPGIDTSTMELIEGRGSAVEPTPAAAAALDPDDDCGDDVEPLEDGACPIEFGLPADDDAVDADDIAVLIGRDAKPAKEAPKDQLPDGAICVAFFKSSACPHCRRVEEALKSRIIPNHPRIFVRTYSVDSGMRQNQELIVAYGETYDIPQERRSGVPQIYVKDKAFTSETDFFRDFEDYIKELETSTDETIPCRLDDSDEIDVTRTIAERFERFGIWIIILAGLIDGLNPCAFATLIFLVTGLLFMKKAKRDILLVGASFALAIYVTYFALGIGIMQGLTAFQEFQQLAYWIYPVTAAVAGIFGVYSIIDYIKAKRGNVEEMSLKLPPAIRKFNERFLRRSMKMKTFPLFAFGAGVIIAVTEFLCTGQVYLPTIVYMTGHPDYRTKAIYFLALYNFLFILPLIVVFVMVYFGASSKKIAQVSQKYLPMIKLGTGILFIGLAYFLFQFYTPMDIRLIIGRFFLTPWGLAIGALLLFLFVRSLYRSLAKPASFD